MVGVLPSMDADRASSSRRRRRTEVITVSSACALLGVLGARSGAAVTSAAWLSPNDGTWTDAINWSSNPFAPNNGNPAGTTYNATIAASGGVSYIVSLPSSVTVDALLVDSVTATVNQSAGTLSLATTGALINSGRYQLAGGNITGAGAFNINPAAVFDWTAGAMAGTGITTNNSGALTRLPGSGGTRTLARLFNNDGVINLTGGFLSLNNGTLANGPTGVMNFAPLTGINIGGGTNNLWTNAGALNYNLGGTATSFTSITPVVPVNSGTINVTVGTLDLGMIGIVHNAGAIVTGAGIVSMGVGTQQLNADVTFSPAGGIFMNGGNVAGPGNFTIGSTLNWNAGSFLPGGSVINPSGNVVNAAGQFQLKQLNRRFENNGTLNIASNATINMNGGTFANGPTGVVNLSAGSGFSSTGSTNPLTNAGTINVPVSAGSLAISVQLAGGGGTLNNDGTVVIFAGGSNVGRVEGAGDLIAFTQRSSSADHVRQHSLSVQASATLSINATGTDAGTSNVASLLLAGSTGAWTGTLDLIDNDLMYDHPGGVNPLGTTIDQVRTARAGGAWTGRGITSTAARNDPNHTTGLGVLTGGEWIGFHGAAPFSGQPVDTSSVLVKYTWNGDANLDGRITFDDYVRIDSGFNTHLTGWSNGDFNYDGVVGFDDYVLIDIAFNQQNGTLGRAIDWISGDDRSGSGRAATGVQIVSEHFDQLGAAYGQAFLATVPEPSALLIVPAIACLFRRRSRRHSTFTKFTD